MKRTNEKMKYPDHFLGSTHDLVQQKSVFINDIWLKENWEKLL